MVDIERKRADLTNERKNVFLKTLSETGSTVAAAAAATPWAKERHGGLQGFRDARKRDPQFAADWDLAAERALAAVESEIWKRAMEPTERPIVSKGQVVAIERQFDNKLLLSLVRRLAPEAWSERKQIEHGGQINHDHRHAAVAILEPADVLLLERDDQETMMGLLEQIAQRKGESEDEPKQIPSSREG